MTLFHVIKRQAASTALDALDTQELKDHLGESRDAICNISLGISAIGSLLGNTAADCEVGQETAERLGWLLEELGGAIYGLLSVETACTNRLRAQGGREE
ncbi:hypothetical protein [Pseudomonas nicosulfuronedens]